MKTKHDISHPNRFYASLNRLISSTVLLSAEDEHALACDGSPKARDRLILSHLLLVKSIALRFKDYGVDVKDCFDQGVIGLIKAVDRYDPTRGRLATFAHRFILGEILCYLNKNQKFLHLPKEPIILYKTTQPSKPQANVGDTVSPDGHNHTPDHDHNHSHDHDHSHDTAPDFRTVQGPPNSDAYDWRDDRAFDAQRPKTDPWKKSDVQQTDTETSTNSSEDSEIYPPPNWHLTKDPALRAEYFHAQLINQFGDIPEVHTVAAYQRKKELGIPVTIDEYIESLEARYHLWPNKSILRALERLRKEREE